MGERSSSPMINIPRLDLSKVIPYDKTQKTKSVVQPPAPPPKEKMQTIQYTSSQANSTHLVKHHNPISLSPSLSQSAGGNKMDKSFTYYPSQHLAQQTIVTSTQNSLILDVSQDVGIDATSDVLSRQVNKGNDTLSVSSSHKGGHQTLHNNWSATSSSALSNDQSALQRKKSNPPVVIPPLDLTKLTTPSEQPTRKQSTAMAAAPQ